MHVTQVQVQMPGAGCLLAVRAESLSPPSPSWPSGLQPPPPPAASHPEVKDQQPKVQLLPLPITCDHEPLRYSSQTSRNGPSCATSTRPARGRASPASWSLRQTRGSRHREAPELHGGMLVLRTSRRPPMRRKPREGVLASPTHSPTLDMLSVLAPEIQMSVRGTALLPQFGNPLALAVWSFACGEEQVVQNVVDLFVMKTKPQDTRSCHTSF